MGKKYIIELEDKPVCVFDEDTQTYFPRLHRVKGFNSLVFDQNGLNNLTPYTEPDTEKVRKEAYEQGLSDAKEGKATCQYCEYQYLDDTEEPCKKCCKAYMNKYKPKAKEQQIQVGDEVRNIKNGWIAVVCNIDGECMTLMDTNGALGDGYDVNRFTKTGRHFPEIAEVLRKMKEES